MTFGGNTSPKRRVRPKRTEWQCVCVVAGRRKLNPAWLVRCSTCGCGSPGPTSIRAMIDGDD